MNREDLFEVKRGAGNLVADDRREEPAHASTIGNDDTEASTHLHRFSRES